MTRSISDINKDIKTEMGSVVSGEKSIHCVLELAKERERALKTLSFDRRKENRISE